MLAMYFKGIDQLHCYIAVQLIYNSLSIFKQRFSQDAAGRSSYEPHCEKTGLRGFRPGPTKIGLYSNRRWLEA